MRFLFFLFSVLGLAGTAARAEAPPGADVRALAREAVERSPLTRSRAFESDAAQAQIDAARQQYRPTPSASLDSSRGRTLRLTQPLWTGGKLDARLSQAQTRAAVAALAQEVEAQRLALRVIDIAQAFTTSVGRAKAQRGTIDTLESLAGMIERRAQAQVSSQADRTLVTARLAQARADLAQYEAAARQAQAQMDQVMGQPTPLAPVRPPDAPPDLPLATLQARACEAAPAIALARAQERSALADVAAADAQKWPTLSLVAQRARAALPGSVTDNRLFLSLDYTPGAGTSAASEAAAARLRAQAARSAIDAACQDAGEQLAALHGQVESAQARVPHLARLLETSADVLASDRRLFVAGRRSWQELLNSARELSQAELQLHDAQALLGVAAARLELLSGRAIWRDAPLADTP